MYILTSGLWIIPDLEQEYIKIKETKNMLCISHIWRLSIFVIFRLTSRLVRFIKNQQIQPELKTNKNLITLIVDR